MSQMLNLATNDFDCSDSSGDEAEAVSTSMPSEPSKSAATPKTVAVLPTTERIKNSSKGRGMSSGWGVLESMTSPPFTNGGAVDGDSDSDSEGSCQEDIVADAGAILTPHENMTLTPYDTTTPSTRKAEKKAGFVTPRAMMYSSDTTSSHARSTDPKSVLSSMNTNSTGEKRKSKLKLVRRGSSSTKKVAFQDSDKSKASAQSKSATIQTAIDSMAKINGTPIQPNDNYLNVLEKLKFTGWTHLGPFGLNIDDTFVLPGGKTPKGLSGGGAIEGVDYVVGKAGVMKFVAETWGWVGEGEGDVGKGLDFALESVGRGRAKRDLKTKSTTQTQKKISPKATTPKIAPKGAPKTTPKTTTQKTLAPKTATPKMETPIMNTTTPKGNISSSRTTPIDSAVKTMRQIKGTPIQPNDNYLNVLEKLKFTGWKHENPYGLNIGDTFVLPGGKHPRKAGAIEGIDYVIGDEGVKEFAMKTWGWAGVTKEEVASEEVIEPKKAKSKPNGQPLPPSPPSPSPQASKQPPKQPPKQLPKQQLTKAKKKKRKKKKKKKPRIITIRSPLKKPSLDKFPSRVLKNPIIHFSHAWTTLKNDGYTHSTSVPRRKNYDGPRVNRDMTDKLENPYLYCVHLNSKDQGELIRGVHYGGEDEIMEIVREKDWEIWEYLVELEIKMENSSSLLTSDEFEKVEEYMLEVWTWAKVKRIARDEMDPEEEKLASRSKSDFWYFPPGREPKRIGKQPTVEERSSGEAFTDLEMRVVALRVIKEIKEEDADYGVKWFKTGGVEINDVEEFSESSSSESSSDDDEGLVEVAVEEDQLKVASQAKQVPKPKAKQQKKLKPQKHEVEAPKEKKPPPVPSSSEEEYFSSSSSSEYTEESYDSEDQLDSFLISTSTHSFGISPVWNYLKNIGWKWKPATNLDSSSSIYVSPRVAESTSSSGSNSNSGSSNLIPMKSAIRGIDVFENQFSLFDWMDSDGSIFDEIYDNANVEVDSANLKTNYIHNPRLVREGFLRWIWAGGGGRKEKKKNTRVKEKDKRRKGSKRGRSESSGKGKWEMLKHTAFFSDQINYNIHNNIEADVFDIDGDVDGADEERKGFTHVGGNATKFLLSTAQAKIAKNRKEKAERKAAVKTSANKRHGRRFKGGLRDEGIDVDGGGQRGEEKQQQLQQDQQQQQHKQRPLAHPGVIFYGNKNPPTSTSAHRNGNAELPFQAQPWLQAPLVHSFLSANLAVGTAVAVYGFGSKKEYLRQIVRERGGASLEIEGSKVLANSGWGTGVGGTGGEGNSLRNLNNLGRGGTLRSTARTTRTSANSSRTFNIDDDIAGLLKATHELEASKGGGMIGSSLLRTPLPSSSSSSVSVFSQILDAIEATCKGWTVSGGTGVELGLGAGVNSSLNSNMDDVFLNSPNVLVRRASYVGTRIRDNVIGVCGGEMTGNVIVGGCLTLVIHSIDSPALLGCHSPSMFLTPLAALIKCSRGAIRLLCSVDNLNSALLLSSSDVTDEGGLDFVFLEATTYQRYDEEVAFGLGMGEKPPKKNTKKRKEAGGDEGGDDEADGGTRRGTQTGLSYVLRSLAPRHASLLKLLAREQLKNQNKQREEEAKGKTGGGGKNITKANARSSGEVGMGAIEYRVFRDLASKDMLHSDDRSLRVMMKELEEHQLLATGTYGSKKRRKDGGDNGGGEDELVFIPQNPATLISIVKWTPQSSVTE